MKKKLLLMMISLTTVSAVGVTMYYEVLSNGPGGPGGGTDPGVVVPIDGGLGLLMLAGAAIGAKRLKDQKRKKDN
ncbi:MAG: hypothetical protein RL732_1103 [Bacteroidota bacterium]